MLLKVQGFMYDESISCTCASYVCISNADIHVKTFFVFRSGFQIQVVTTFYFLQVFRN